MKKTGMGLKLGNQPTHAMLLNELKVIKIFCEIDDFVKGCEKIVDGKLLGSKSPHAVNEPGLYPSEMMCIELLYHLSG
ncbi:MAG: hypothetical protein ACK5NK_07410, partial [Niabella sp.]